MRIGKRKDPHPVLVEIQAQQASEEGVPFYQANPLIYVTDHIPPSYLNGPPISKVLSEPKRPQKRTPQQQQEEEPLLERELPGSVLLNVRMEPLHKNGRGKTWKDHSRKHRRGKRQI